jgi:hypothetical protein
MMETQSFADPPGNLVIVIGLVLSALSAFVPFHEAGYRLMIGVLLAGMLPYLVYAVAVPLLGGPLTAVVGVALVIAHAWLVISERYSSSVDYSDGMIYYVPMLMAVAVLPLAVIALRQPWGNRMKSAQEDQAANDSPAHPPDAVN